MMKDTTNSTVLTEHGGVSLARHLLSLVVFLAVLAGSIVTWFFMGRRGAPDGILIILYLQFAVNGLQILLCFIDFVSKYSGRYLKALAPISWAVGALWVLILAAQIFVGYAELGDVRIDLIVIAGIQLVFALIAYFVWPWMDYRAVNALTLKNTRNDPKKRRSKCIRYVVSYVLLALVLVVVQAGVLVAYRIPPKVYDLFADTRAVRYTPTEDGTGYIVTGIYEGTSPTVVIPATHNNRPVVGIAEGAIVDVDLVESHRINSIILGSEETDADGNKQLVSNLQYIETGAIVNDHITSLTIPESVTRMADAAIDCRALTVLNYRARADFSISYLSCESLKEITVTGDNVGQIVSLAGMSANVTLKIGKDIYNEYKRANIAFSEQFVPILGDGEIYIDFYTDSDYYLDSIFSGTSSVIDLHYSQLVNPALDGPGLSVDTLAYINDPHELGTEGAKADSAFRGWYYDETLQTECTFSQGESVRFVRSAKLYAKWIDEYTGVLDWGTYRPADQPAAIYWTDEDVVDVPAVTDRVGYAGGVVWKVNGTAIKNTETLNGNTTLHAEWLLDAPAVDVKPVGFDGNGVMDAFSIYNDNNTVRFTYDEDRYLTLQATVTHGLDGVSYNDLTTWYTYEWTKVGNGDYVETAKDVVKQIVSDTGDYLLTVVAHSPYGETSSASSAISVTVIKKKLETSLPDLRFEDGTTVYDGEYQTLPYIDREGDVGRANVAATYVYELQEGVTAGGNSGVRNVGKYSVTLTFSKNDARDRANYTDLTLYADFEIIQRSLSFIRWQGVGDGNWTVGDNDVSIVYDGNPHTVEMVYDGVVSADSAQFALQYEDNSATDADETHFVRVVGCNNGNYSVENIKLRSCAFSVSPRPIKVNRWTLDGNQNSNIMTAKYDSREHYVTVSFSDTIQGDTLGVELTGDRARDAGEYLAKINRLTGDDAKNYTFPADASQVWGINAKELTISMSSRAYVYNGNAQTVVATVSGFTEGEASAVQMSMFDFTGTTTPERSGTDSSGNYVITFSATEANPGSGDHYNAVIKGLLNTSGNSVLRNYTISATSATLTISPRKITFTVDHAATYNGQEQELSVTVGNLIENDIPQIQLADFNFSTLSATRFDATTHALIYRLKEAGTYDPAVEQFNDTNYEIDGGRWSGHLVINKRNIWVNGWSVHDSATNADQPLGLTGTYNAVYNYHGYTIKPLLGGVVQGEEVELDLTNGIEKEVGDYKSDATLDGARYPNYTFTPASLSWHITPYVLNFTWTARGQEEPLEISDGTVSFTYDAEAWSVKPSYTALMDDEISLQFASSTDTATDFGTYTVTINGTGNKNYTLGENKQLIWKIAAKPVTVKWAETPTTGEYNGAYQGPGFSLEGLIESEVAEGELSVSYTVNRTSFANSGLLSGLDMPLNTGNSYSFTETYGHAVDVGEYEFSLVAIRKGGADSKNYTFTSSQQSFTITQKTIGLADEWKYSNTVATEGAVAFSTDAHLVYNTYAYVFTKDIASGVVERLGSRDEIGLSYSGAEATDYKAEGYTALVTGITGTYGGNYKLPAGDLSCKYAIEQKVISLTWASDEKTFTGHEQTQTVSYETVDAMSGNATDRKVYNGYSAELIKENVTGTNATTYNASVSLAADSNYKFDENSNTTHAWTIKPRPVSLTWTYSSTVYNGEVQYPTASYVYNDITVKASSYDGSWSTSKDANDGAEEEKYTITATLLDNSNFTLIEGTNVTHEYTITKRVLEFEWQIQGTGTKAESTYSYDGTSKTVIAHVKNLCNEDVLSLQYTDNTLRDAKSYTVTLTATGNDNYSIPESDKSFSVVVNPAVVQLEWSWDDSTSETSFTFDGNEHSLTPKVTNTFAEDEVKLQFSENKLLNQGTITVTVNGVENENYTISGATNLSKQLTVLKQKVSIEWAGDETVVYDGHEHSLTPTVTGADDHKGGIAEVQYSNSSNLTNVGSTVVTVSLTNDNYTLDDAVYTKTLTITPQPVKITWTGNGTQAYNGETFSITASVIGRNDEQGVDFQYRSGGGSSTDAYTIQSAGELKVSIELKNNNYTSDGAEGETSATLVITKQVVNVSWTGLEGGNSLVYDGKLHTLTATLTGATTSAPVEFTYSVSGSNYASDHTIQNVGTLTTTVVLSDSSNYTFDGGTGETTKTLTITPQPVKISWTWDGESEQKTFTFDSEVHTLLATVVGKNDSESVDFTYKSTGGTYGTDNTLSKAGTLTVGLTLSNNNYTLDGAEGEASATLIIAKQAVKITWDGDNSLTYDGNAHQLTASVVGDTDGKTVGFSYVKGNSLTDAGSLEVKVQLTDGNYEITEASGSDAKTLEIKPLVAQFSWDGAESQTYNGSTFSRTATITNLARSENVTITYSAERTSEYGYIGAASNGTANAGEYTVTITALSNKNYTIDGASELTAKLKILPQKVRITWKNSGSYVYNGNSVTLEANVVGADTNSAVNIVYSVNSRTLNGVGTITANISLSANNYTNTNYTLDEVEGSTTATLTVTPLVVTVNWTGTEVNSFDGSGHARTATITNAFLSDRLTLGYTLTRTSEKGDESGTGNSATHAGTYTVTLVSLGNENYTLDEAENLTAPLTINQRVANVGWSGELSIVYDGSEHSLTPTVTGLNGADLSPTFTTSDGKAAAPTAGIKAFKDVGTYTYTITGIGSDDYTLNGITDLSKQMQITQRKAEISWAGDTVVTYNGAAHALTASVSNAAGHDTFKITYTNSKVSEYGTITGGSNGTTAAGVYNITLAGIGNDNYTLAGVEGLSQTLTIKQQKVRITWTGAGSFAYNGAAHKLTVSVTDISTGMPVPHKTTGTDTLTNVGSTTVKVTELDTTNYVLDDATGSVQETLTITKQKVKIVWTGAGSFDYDGKAHNLSAAVTDIATGAEVAFKTNGTATITNVGTITLTVTLNTDNYTLEGLTGTTSESVTVNARVVTLGWTAPSDLVENGSIKQFTLWINNLATGDNANEVTLSYTITDATGKTVQANEITKAGTYTVTVNGLGGAKAGNYTLNGTTTKSFTFTIKAAAPAVLEEV